MLCSVKFLFCFFQYDFHIFQEYVLPASFPRWNGRTYIQTKISYLGGSPYHDSCVLPAIVKIEKHMGWHVYNTFSFSWLDASVQNIQKSEYSLAPNNKLLLLVFVNVEPLWLGHTYRWSWKLISFEDNFSQKFIWNLRKKIYMKT